ncbi:hypothetical protein ABL78_8475 [Leptomonas seymouri]|uniref:Uncharacterized protein n=1 Tax=Leptomonas seymouri TaxID=5684 RepID=A0A0N1HZ45_LEPSE|nr:hypothetical protein ABL78_8475 [Leptomonas seymouri]|eukprot:KPI82515.1 hypothetical protein ABL78_8475 [Leptomonas seymouri]
MPRQLRRWARHREASAAHLGCTPALLWQWLPSPPASFRRAFRQRATPQSGKAEAATGKGATTWDLAEEKGAGTAACTRRRSPTAIRLPSDSTASQQPARSGSEEEGVLQNETSSSTFPLSENKKEEKT